MDINTKNLKKMPLEFLRIEVIAASRIRVPGG